MLARFDDGIGGYRFVGRAKFKSSSASVFILSEIAGERAIEAAFDRC